MRFAIRDDDTNFFTRPGDLQAAYGPHWGRVPVSLAVVPFHAGTKSGAIPEEHWTGSGMFPVGDNAELAAFLRDAVRSGAASILLHGFSHRGAEFDTSDELGAQVSAGRDYLERVFSSPVTVFVPPHNALSRRGMAAVIRNRFNLLGSFSLRPDRHPWEVRLPLNWWRRSRFRQAYALNPDTVYPRVLRYSSHGELACVPLVPGVGLDRLQGAFRFIARTGGTFCLATHYWELNSIAELRTTLHRFVDWALAQDGVQPVHAAELFT